MQKVTVRTTEMVAIALALAGLALALKTDTAVDHALSAVATTNRDVIAAKDEMRDRIDGLAEGVSDRLTAYCNMSGSSKSIDDMLVEFRKLQIEFARDAQANKPSEVDVLAKTH